jgi:hypothetical protein
MTLRPVMQRFHEQGMIAGGRCALKPDAHFARDLRRLLWVVFRIELPEPGFFASL